MTNTQDTEPNTQPPQTPRIGRPPVWTEEKKSEAKAAAIEHLYSGKSLGSFARQPTNPSWATLFKWMDEDASFKDAYLRARALSGHVHADRVIEVGELVEAGVIDAASARVIAQGAQWYAGKLRPKDYGDRVDLTGEVNHNILPGYVQRLVLRKDREAAERGEPTVLIDVTPAAVPDVETR